MKKLSRVIQTTIPYLINYERKYYVSPFDSPAMAPAGPPLAPQPVVYQPTVVQQPLQAAVVTGTVVTGTVVQASVVGSPEEKEEAW